MCLHDRPRVLLYDQGIVIPRMDYGRQRNDDQVFTLKGPVLRAIGARDVSGVVGSKAFATPAVQGTDVPRGIARRAMCQSNIVVPAIEHDGRPIVKGLTRGPYLDVFYAGNHWLDER